MDQIKAELDAMMNASSNNQNATQNNQNANSNQDNQDPKKLLRHSFDSLSSDKLSIKDNIINQWMIVNNMKVIHTSLAFSNDGKAAQLPHVPCLETVTMNN